jgi:predicted double-glycine peptidase
VADAGASGMAGRPAVRSVVALAAIVSCMVAFGARADGRERFHSLKEIRERGLLMQQWEASCAAAAVATVLTYGFDDPVSERYAALHMLERTDVQRVRRRGGFSLLDLMRFAEERGYQASAYKHLGVEDLRLFHAPIVPIDQHGYNHYVVMNGVSNGRVLLADPAFGNRDIAIGEFREIWLDGMAFVISRPYATKERP